MTIPPSTHPIWNQMLTGRISWRVESLPIKIFLGSAKLQLTKDPSPSHVSRLAGELRELFIKNEKLPSVQKDLANIK